MAAPTPADIAYMMEHMGEDRRPNYIVANSVCIGVAIIAVFLRYISRFLAGTKYGLDDYTILISLIFTLGFEIGLFVSVHYGMGRHAILVTDVKSFAITALTAEVLYNVSIMITKLSILLLFDRIFPLQWFRRTNLTLGTFIVLYSVTQMFGTIFQCVPIHAKWTPGVVPKCINYVAMIISCGAINIITDFIMLVLPIPILWKLQVSQHRKWVLMLMFLMGAFVCVISIVRLFYAQHVDTVDPTWDFVWPSMISGLECCSAILTACIPTYRPLVNKIRHGVASENTVPRSTKPSTKSSGGGYIGTPLRRMLRGKLIDDDSSNSTTERHDYDQIGKGTDSEARINSETEWDQSPAKNQEILVTHTFSSERV